MKLKHTNKITIRLTETEARDLHAYLMFLMDRDDGVLPKDPMNARGFRVAERIKDHLYITDAV